MTPLVLYAAALFGTCYIVGQSKITLGFRRRLLQVHVHVDKPRAWHASFLQCDADRRSGAIWVPFAEVADLLQCPACLSTWIGFVLAWRLPALAATVAAPIPTLSRPLPFALLSCGIVAIISFATGVMNAQE